MEKSLKNIASVLIILTVAFLGYYLFSQRDQGTLSFDQGGTLGQEQFVEYVQKYIERRQVLSSVALDTSIFNDAYFQSLDSYATPVPPQPVGRSNPFDEVR